MGRPITLHEEYLKVISVQMSLEFMSFDVACNERDAVSVASGHLWRGEPTSRDVWQRLHASSMDLCIAPVY